MGVARVLTQCGEGSVPSSGSEHEIENDHLASILRFCRWTPSPLARSASFPSFPPRRTQRTKVAKGSICASPISRPRSPCGGESGWVLQIGAVGDV